MLKKKSDLVWLSLWEGISKRLNFRDKGGTTTQSEAPAEGFFFSTLSYIIENKPGLSVEHMFQLCRIVKEGPVPATKATDNISKKTIEQWQAQSIYAQIDIRICITVPF